MSHSTEQSGRWSRTIAATLLPMLALVACSSQDEALNEKVAAAEAAAAKALVAQQAAEKAAAAALSSRPAPSSAPAVAADTPNPWEIEDDSEADATDDGTALTRGGEGQTVSSNGVVIPGDGA